MMPFKDTIEYPGELLIDGPREGILYDYAGSWYLNGIVNFTKPLAAYMLIRYCEGGHAEAIAKIGDDFAGANVCGHDDVILLRTSHAGQRLWVFHFDMDSSDCRVGWVANTEENRVAMQAWLREQAEAMFANYQLQGSTAPEGGPLLAIPKLPKCVQW
jgi:hypothetical protein